MTLSPTAPPTTPSSVSAPRLPAAIALVLAALIVAAGPARGAEVRLFRPLTADPRESQTRFIMSNYVEDWRYGTDVSDSTSQGGYVTGREGVSWEVSAGNVFQWAPLQRILSWRGPWVRYQLGAPAAMFSRFDGSGILLNTDYQYGASFDAMWRGEYDPARGVTSYANAVVTSRLTVMHHSSHLGDEYYSQGSFGRNQTSPPYQGPGLGRPPVKRVDLSYEDVALTLSIERSGADEKATLRAYGGAELKLSLPSSWNIGGVQPSNFTSPVYRLGLEYRSSGANNMPTDLPLGTWLNALVRAKVFDNQWLAAIDLKLAKPYNFASADNPAGETEAWTPRLWTAVPYGREYRNYAGSWHGLIGSAIQRRISVTGAPQARSVGPEWILALEWFHGYAPDGQLLDQRLSYRPRFYILPSITAHF